ncbi:MAG: NERD domain-containing protein [Candidatus Omnitrophica bacterium]|nr:NERD domain-containing protein [Candidatus Omnitrophota bacterium]
MTGAILKLYLILGAFIALGVFLKSPWFKGRFGEGTVRLSFKMLLDKDKYRIINNVTLPTENGTTQIDHIILSVYGIFVVETKNMKGWIFGSADQKTWTQKIYSHTGEFQNPLHQNYKHVKTLQALLGLNDKQIYSVVAFAGESEFKTDMPENVTSGGGELARFIKSKTEQVFTESEVSEITAKIEEGRLTPSLKTEREHVKHVRQIAEEKKAANLCPRCGSPMVLREVKKGQNSGKKFWGCSKYPQCKGIINIT